jgi:hypothetical protein
MKPCASKRRLRIGERTFRFHNFREALAFVQQVGELAESRRPSPRYQFRLGSRDRFSKHQEDQGIARERFHHGEQDRPHGRSAGSDSNRNSAVTLRDAGRERRGFDLSIVFAMSIRVVTVFGGTGFLGRPLAAPLFRGH